MSLDPVLRQAECRTRGGLGMKPIILLEELEHTLPDALTLLYADDPGRAGADWKFSFAELYGG